MLDTRIYGLIEDGLDWALYTTLVTATVLFVFVPDLLSLSAIAPLAGIGLFSLAG